MKCGWKELRRLMNGSIQEGILLAEVAITVILEDSVCVVVHEICTSMLLNDDMNTRMNAANLLGKLCETHRLYLTRLILSTESDGELLRIEDIDVHQVISSGLELRSSSNISSLEEQNDKLKIYSKDWIADQRELLVSRLGIEASTADASLAVRYMDIEGLVYDDLFLVKTTSKSRMNSHKRKRIAKSNPVEEDTTHPIDNATDANACKETWFVRIIRFLVINLLDSSWSVRHGCALGLTSIVSSLTSESSSSSSSLTDMELPYFLIQDIVCSSLYLLTIDKFVDFSETVAMPPVKDACGRLLATASMRLNSQHEKLILAQLSIMCKSDHWTVLCGGLLSFSHLLARRPSIITQLAIQLQEYVIVSLRHSVDEVVLVGSHLIKNTCAALCTSPSSTADIGTFLQAIASCLRDVVSRNIDQDIIPHLMDIICSISRSCGDAHTLMETVYSNCLHSALTLLKILKPSRINIRTLTTFQAIITACHTHILSITDCQSVVYLEMLSSEYAAFIGRLEPSSLDSSLLKLLSQCTTIVADIIYSVSRITVDNDFMYQMMHTLIDSISGVSLQLIQHLHPVTGPLLCHLAIGLCATLPGTKRVCIFTELCEHLRQLSEHILISQSSVPAKRDVVRLENSLEKATPLLRLQCILMLAIELTILPCFDDELDVHKIQEQILGIVEEKYSADEGLTGLLRVLHLVRNFDIPGLMGEALGGGDMQRPAVIRCLVNMAVTLRCEEFRATRTLAVLFSVRGTDSTHVAAVVSALRMRLGSTVLNYIPLETIMDYNVDLQIRLHILLSLMPVISEEHVQYLMGCGISGILALADEYPNYNADCEQLFSAISTALLMLFAKYSTAASVILSEICQRMPTLIFSSEVSAQSNRCSSLFLHLVQCLGELILLTNYGGWLTTALQGLGHFDTRIRGNCAFAFRYLVSKAGLVTTTNGCRHDYISGNGSAGDVVAQILGGATIPSITDNKDVMNTLSSVSSLVRESPLCTMLILPYLSDFL
jgi:hypothetical protein